MKTYICYNKKTGLINYVHKVAERANAIPTLSKNDTERFVLAEVPESKIPKGEQVLGRYEVDLKKAHKGTFKLVKLTEDVNPIKLV